MAEVSPEPIALPMLGERRERADAAANRQRILAAARELLAEKGVEGLTMQAVAEAAGVGKGTVFHRFGDRDGLTGALIDEYMREFQEAFLRGAPPLGPGAPAAERLEAFVAELVHLQVDHLEAALAAEGAVAEELAPAYSILLIHLSNLISEINPRLDSWLLAAYLLSALAPPVLHRLHDHGGIDVPRLQEAAVQMARGISDQAVERDS